MVWSPKDYGTENTEVLLIYYEMNEPQPNIKTTAYWVQYPLKNEKQMLRGKKSIMRPDKLVQIFYSV